MGAKYGQHFLTRPEIAGWVADAAEVIPGDTVLEIGPGEGILTGELLKRGAKVLALEIDENLVKKLRNRFADELNDEKLVIEHSDLRDFDPTAHGLVAQSYKLVANIPYYLTGDILRRFVGGVVQPSCAALLVQKEVAERVVARDGKESILSIAIKVYGTPRYIKTVKAGAFSPPPKVDSAILLIEHINRSAFEDTTHGARFFKLLRAGFAHKRKMLGANLKGFVSHEELVACGIDPKARAEELGAADWCCLATPMCLDTG